MAGAVPTGARGIDLKPGSHVCAFYQGAADRERLLNAYLSAGLCAGGKCVCVAGSAQTASRLESLRESGAGSAAPGGQLDVHLPESTYLAGGAFTGGGTLTFWTENLVKAQIEGYTSFGFAGAPAWIFPRRDHPPNVTASYIEPGEFPISAHA